MRIARTVLTLAAASACALAFACGGAEEDSEPPPLDTNVSRRRDPRADAGGLDDASSAGTPDGGREATTFKGTLAATPTVNFGGGDYCEYTITLKNVEVEVDALDSGEIIRAIVRDRVSEAIVPPCEYAPLAPADQSFTLTTATKTASGVTLAFDGAATNQPETSLVIDLTRVGSTYEAHVGWKRTDTEPPLDWAVTVKMRLTPR